jgi:hypothetical protein
MNEEEGQKVVEETKEVKERKKKEEEGMFSLSISLYNY